MTLTCDSPSIRHFCKRQERIILQRTNVCNCNGHDLGSWHPCNSLGNCNGNHLDKWDMCMSHGDEFHEHSLRYHMDRKRFPTETLLGGISFPKPTILPKWLQNNSLKQLFLQYVAIFFWLHEECFCNSCSKISASSHFFCEDFFAIILAAMVLDLLPDFLGCDVEMSLPVPEWWNIQGFDARWSCTSWSW